MRLIDLVSSSHLMRCKRVDVLQKRLSHLWAAFKHAGQLSGRQLQEDAVRLRLRPLTALHESLPHFRILPHLQGHVNIYLKWSIFQKTVWTNVWKNHEYLSGVWCWPAWRWGVTGCSWRSLPVGGTWWGTGWRCAWAAWVEDSAPSAAASPPPEPPTCTRSSPRSTGW